MDPRQHLESFMELARTAIVMCHERTDDQLLLTQGCDGPPPASKHLTRDEKSPEGRMVGRTKEGLVIYSFHPAHVVAWAIWTGLVRLSMPYTEDDDQTMSVAEGCIAQGGRHPSARDN